MDYFVPAMNPSQSGTSGQQQPRLLVAQFGDGYKQTSPDGLNTVPVTLTLSWNSLLNADANAILNFLRAHQGQTFLWQAPSDTLRKWQAMSWTWNYLSAEVMAVNTTFNEFFDLS